MSSERDPQVGAAIRALPVPEREPDFTDGLVARLDAADAERGGAPPADGPVGTAVPLRRRRRLVIAAAVAAAAVAAVFAIMLLGPGREAAHQGGLPQPIAPLGGPEPATAKQVIRASLRATGSAAYLKGVMTAGTVEKGRFVPGASESFLVSSTGSYRVSARRLGPAGGTLPSTFGWLSTPFGRMQATQDAPLRTGRVLWRVPDPKDPALVLHDMPAGEPYLSRYFPADLVLLTLRSYLRQLLERGSLVLRQVAVDGRECWVIDTTMASGGDGSWGPVANRVRIAVDKQTLFPVRFTSTSGGAVGQVRISYVDAGTPPANAFKLVIPRSAHLVPSAYDFSVGPHGSSAGFKTIPFGDQTVMHDWIHDTPGFPTWMPDGFARTGATYAATGGVDDGSGMHPEQDSCVVSLAYRHGFDTIYVGAQPTDYGNGFMELNGKKYRTHFGDPFAQLYGPRWRYYRSRTRDVVIRSGPFAGRVGHIVVDPSVLPHLWVRDVMFTATVSGDLSAADMVRVVESLASGVQVGAGDAVAR
jgi:hypothetical protein